MTFRLTTMAIAGLSLLAASFSALAANIPRPVYKGVRSVISYYNWTGFYLGANGGYGFGKSDWDLSAISIKPDGGMFGGTIGYNYQTGSIVWGIEGDIDWSDIKGSTACGGDTCEVKNTYLGTFRGRLGYAFDRFLPYITAGGAYGQIKANILTTGQSSSSSQFGWTAGGGLEYAFLGNWTTKIEYLYVDLGDFDNGFSAPLADNVSFKANIILAGLNYKFAGPIFSRF